MRWMRWLARAPWFRRSTQKTLSGDQGKTANSPVVVADPKVRDQAFIDARKAIADLKETGGRKLDLKHLSGLTQLPPEIEKLPLTELVLAQMSGNYPHIDLGPLKRIETLESLTCGGATLDLMPLTDLPSLRRLVLSDCMLPDAMQLGRLRRLEVLELVNFDRCVETDTMLRALVDLPRLTSLTLFDCSLHDPSPLTELVRLESLTLDLLFIDDGSMTPPALDARLLAPLTRLKVLSVSEAGLSDIGPLTKLTALEDFNISGNELTDLSPLSGLTNLRALTMSSLPVGDLSTLAPLTKLQDLWALSRVATSDLTPLSGLTSLKSLAVSVAGTDLSVLGPLKRLEELVINADDLQDLSQLGALTSLKRLTLDGAGVSDISMIPKLTALEELNLRRTNVQSLDPLRGLTTLKINAHGLT
nr:leucine-rich repeat domain-containing protein [Roseobacter sp. GAI101]